ncbi:MAG: site-specific DNA-methyltransferase [Gemmatimonadetes bacterium]|nr:site-specific DNA-methyltransferase [Gemmatimonadota bacterium]MYH51652.1 site-specific DNA-methyltransferase [Gemmatimonadota bacterium]MYK67843.1 site-specific DNA-methyltransferase [Gemmatimonadota bacterium]
MSARLSDAGSGELFVRESSPEYDKGPVTCLGRTFESEEARRGHFLERLREKLPELRERPDFPHAEDEDILRMSDPPYYTACPNPFLADFVAYHGRPYHPDEEYHREPYAVDVSVGKTDKLYRAHGYHTKVPHLAIVPSILHYTKPGDIVLDGFCGSGMTGVAAEWCGTAPESYRKKLEQRWKQEGRDAPEWGARRVILGDLSPAATFIAANYNIPFDVDEFAEAARQLLDDVEDEVGWMYETVHTDGKTGGRINYTVWSEVFSCPECAGEVVFTREALDMRTKRVRPSFPCPGCGILLKKRDLARLLTTRIDPVTGSRFQEPRRVPVLIEYVCNGGKCEKRTDDADLRLLDRLSRLPWPAEIPHDRMMHVAEGTERWGDQWRAGVSSFTHVHHLFQHRAAQALAAVWRRASAHPDHRTRGILLFFVEQAILGMSGMNRYGPTHYSQVNRYMAGRVCVLSQQAEVNPWYILRGKLNRLRSAFTPMPSVRATTAVTTGDCATIGLPANSIDYIFTDPPFGDNLAYSELNFFHEAFHRVFTNRPAEAIVSKTQRKDLFDYQRLMTRCFAEYQRVLKPGRWITIVFHNSRNAVWNGIQEALLSAGFVVADVRVLDKKQGTFNQVLAQGSVKKDLVISAYKPGDALEERFRIRKGEEEGAWAFVRDHLRQLPVFVLRDGLVETVVERQRDLLYDRMVAFHVQRGVALPLSAAEFHAGLPQRFAERDDMYFLPEQVASYDRKRMLAGDLHQPDLFVHDEETAIRWLRRELRKKPQSFQDVHPGFIRELAGWGKNETMLELSDLLKENFLLYGGTGEVPAQIHSYLSSNFKHLRNLPKDDVVLRAKAADRWYVPDPRKAGDLERLRERSLLREFDEYRGASKRLKRFRSEAIRAGFRRAWQERDYGTIVAVGRKIPDSVLHNDPKLLMWFDQAVTRGGGGAA